MPYTFNPLSETFDFYKDPTPGGTSGQVQFNNSGVLGGVSTTAVDGSGNLTFSGRWIQSTNGASNAAPYILTGTWFSGGDSTTTKPQLLIEPTGTTSNTWSTAGTGFGVNAPSGFTGNLATFGINGIERMRITASGNVGIGTTSPGVLLEVNGAMTAQGNIFAASGGTTRTITLGPAGAGLEYNTDGTTYLGGRTDAYPLVFRTNSAERLRITSTGNIGIGTAAPGTKLDIAGGLRVVADQNTTGISSNILLDGSPNAISTLLFRQNAGDTQRGFVRINATAANNVQMEFGTANTLRMVIGGNALNGNVGIGTASPLAKLEVKGSTLISTTNSGNNILGFNDVAFAGGTLNGAPDGASGSAFIVGNGSTASGAPSYLSMWTTNGGVVSERMRITSTGNVGIGTASPTAKLEVNNGDIAAGNAANNFRIVVSRTGANPASLVMGAFTDSPAIEFTGALGLRFLAGLGGTEVMRIRNNNLGIGTGNPLSKLVISDSGAQGFEFDPSTGTFQVYNRSTSAYGELRPYGSLIRFFTGTSPSEQMRLDASGNLGIGTASPGGRLDVFNSGVARLTVGAGGLSETYSDANSHFWRTPGGGTELARLNSSGNLGLSAGNAPTQRLSLYAAGSTAQYMSAGNSNTGVNGSIFGVDGTGNAVINNTQAFAILFSTNNTERMRITSAGNIVAGASAALATTATDGFLYVPTCAGTPTGTPTAITGMAPIVVNTTNNKLYFYSGGAWRDAGP